MRFRHHPALLAALALGLCLGCRQEGGEASRATVDLPVDVPPSSPTGPDPEAVDEPMRVALLHVRDRFKCNRISGCPAAGVLLGYGWQATPFLTQLFTSAPPRTVWRPRIVCLLAELGDPAAAPALLQALRDGRDEERGCAIWGLWRVDDRSEDEEIRRFALASGGFSGAAARLAARWVWHQRNEAGFNALFVQELTTRAGQSLASVPVSWGLRLCGMSGSPDCSPALGVASRHPTFVVRRAVLDLVEARPRKAHVPLLLGLLADPIPSIARRARAALVRLSGQPQIRGVAAWRIWWQESASAAGLPAPATAAGLR